MRDRRACFAVLSDTDHRSQTLNKIAQELDKINSSRVRSHLTAASGILAGLVLNEQMISQILRRDIMRESVMYQEILREGELIGEQRGRLEGEQRGIIQAKQEIALNLLKSGMTVEQVVKFTGLPVESVQNLTKKMNS